MSSELAVLQSLLIDLINIAKTTKDAKSRLFQLEQVREILLHREISLVSEFVSEVFDFVLDKSVLIRKFLVKFGNELFSIDSESVFSPLLEMYKYFINDSNDIVVIEIAKAIASKYPQLVLHISRSKSTISSQHWISLRSILSRMYEFIASNRSEELRENCLFLLEQDILFGIQVGGSQTTDPRLSRKVVDPRLQRGSKEVQATSLGTVEEIPLHHPFLSRSEISKESEDWFMKLVLWANKGGPQGSTFTSHLLSVVAQLIASIGSARPNFSINSAQSLSFLMSGKHPFVQGMSKFDRENLVRATHRLLRSASVYVSDPEGHMQKLRSAVSIFETTSNMTSEESTITGKKRDIAIREEDLEEVEEAADIKKRRISEALEAAENQKRNQLLTHAGQNNVTNVRTQLVQSVTNTEFTELATDLAAIELSLVTTEAITLNQLTLSDKVSLQQLFFAPTCLNLSAASALSCATLQQIIIRMFSVLEIFPEIGEYFSELVVRTLLSELVSSDHSTEAWDQVQVITSWGEEVLKEIKDSLPVVVSVPRFFWEFISLCLRPLLDKQDASNVQSRITLLNHFCEILFWYEESTNGVHSSVYENIVYVIISRSIQMSSPVSQSFLQALPKIPKNCVTLLTTLFFSTPKKESLSQKGKIQRDVYLYLLVPVILNIDYERSLSTLHYLLWLSLNNDFEIRSRVVGMLARELCKDEYWCRHEILRFSIHSLIGLIGKNTLEKCLKSYPSSSEFLVFFSSYKQGNDFAGDFQDAIIGDMKINAQKCLHLFLQLALFESRMVSVLSEIFSCLLNLVEILFHEQDSDGSQRCKVLADEIICELKPILPALRGKLGEVEILNLITKVPSTFLKTLVFEVLKVLTVDAQVPPKPELIVWVENFISDGCNDILFCDLPEEKFRMVLCLLGGLPQETVITCLPRILKFYGENPEELKALFAKIITVRPPPLSKSQLLFHLHRIDLEKFELKPKILLDGIALCLNSKAEFSADVVKEALSLLQKEEIPPFALMRTAIISAQSFPEVKRFVLMETIPSMLKKEVWERAPKVWEGVIFGMKNLVSVYNKASDPTFHGLCQIPGVQLKSVLKVATNLSPLLIQYLKSLTPEDYNLLISSDVERNKILRELV